MYFVCTDLVAWVREANTWRDWRFVSGIGGASNRYTNLQVAFSATLVLTAILLLPIVWWRCTHAQKRRDKFCQTSEGLRRDGTAWPPAHRRPDADLVTPFHSACCIGSVPLGQRRVSHGAHMAASASLLQVGGFQRALRGLAEIRRSQLAIGCVLLFQVDVTQCAIVNGRSCLDKVNVGSGVLPYNVVAGMPGYFQGASSSLHHSQYAGIKSIDGNSATDFYSHGIEAATPEAWLSLQLPPNTPVHTVYAHAAPNAGVAYRKERLVPVEVWVSNEEGGRTESVATLCARWWTLAEKHSADCGGVPGSYVTIVKRSPSPLSNHPT